MAETPKSPAPRPRRGIRVVGAGVGGEEDAAALPEPSRRREPATPAPASTPRPEQPVGPPGHRALDGGAKAWSGRLPSTSASIEAFTASIDVDRRLFREDIQTSVAHARMLRRAGLLSAAEVRAIEAGLRDIRREFEKGEFRVAAHDEDLHMAIERRLAERIGEPALKLQTARSRNDQVATDLRLWAKQACRQLMLAVADLQEVLVRRAEKHRHTVLPGYTHLQRAQVVSLAHHLLAYVEMLQRDVERFQAAHERADALPLGSGALAATTLPIDRREVAAELGFSRLCVNSLDAVADRDAVVELVCACAVCMVHLSRLAEEIVLWSSAEFAFAELADEHATGSSLMPQKKNPDVAELVRGRTGRVVGDLVALLTLLKGLPLAYNRDLQEDKPALFDAVDTTLGCLRALTEVVSALHFDEARMRRAAADPGLMATDVAEHLVVRGLPFREAHHIVGRAARLAAESGRTLADLSTEEWAAIDPRVGPEVVDLFDPERSLRRREVVGGPGPRATSRQLVRAATLVAKTRRAVPVLARQPTVAREVGAGVRRRSSDDG